MVGIYHIGYLLECKEADSQGQDHMVEGEIRVGNLVQIDDEKIVVFK